MLADEADKLTYEERIAGLSVGGASLDLRDPRPLKLTVDDLVLLDRYWQDDDHKSTELIDGRIYTTPARYMPRVRVAGEIWKQLWDSAAIITPHLFVGTRGSIKISPYDLPLPDIVLTSEIQGKSFIPVASVPLVVEVAETALDFYMSEKLRLYARGGIPEYWVADVNSRVIYQMWSPQEETYMRTQTIPFGSTITAINVLVLRAQTSGF